MPILPAETACSSCCPSVLARCEAQHSCPVSEYTHSCRRLRRQAAPSSAIAACFPPRRIRPWTGRTLGTDAAPGLSRCSTPPDPLNHIHNRRRGLHGRCFGETEPLRRSRYHLRWSQTDDDVSRSIPRSQTAVCSQLLMLKT